MRCRRRVRLSAGESAAFGHYAIAHAGERVRSRAQAAIL